MSRSFTRRNSSIEGMARARGSKGQRLTAVTTETAAQITFTMASVP
ncbi:MAG TPA: hypothetical protein VMI47_14670 [Pseudolabrys sp.]|nr:hypothetical protein [Pseudolabrys sp.]